MQMFTVPQFIDAEDKIIGAITVRQFLIILAGLIVIAIEVALFDKSLAATLGIPSFLITIALAFVRINGRPFHFFLLNFVQTLKRPNTRVWNHKNKLKDLGNNKEDNGDALQETSNQAMMTPIKKMAENLDDLSLVVDTRGAYKGDNNVVKIIKNDKYAKKN